MSGSVNKVILIGNLGADPEIREFSSGTRYCNLRVATSERWKDRNSGENRERTEWHRVTIYNEHLVRIAEAYLRKGSKVYLEGQLETRKWQDQNGNERYSTDVALRPFRSELTMLDSRGSSDGYQSAGDAGSGRGREEYSERQWSREAGSAAEDSTSDDIPF
ncbi:MAG: single-stranded DNA-binding protein [Rhodobacteraceae bacterium]|nr:single-stranded DNA-binding protein [Paracoccaceae bacterium]